MSTQVLVTVAGYDWKTLWDRLSFSLIFTVTLRATFARVTSRRSVSAVPHDVQHRPRKRTPLQLHSASPPEHVSGAGPAPLPDPCGGGLGPPDPCGGGCVQRLRAGCSLRGAAAAWRSWAAGTAPGETCVHRQRCALRPAAQTAGWGRPLRAVLPPAAPAPPTPGPGGVQLCEELSSVCSASRTPPGQLVRLAALKSPESPSSGSPPPQRAGLSGFVPAQCVFTFECLPGREA